MERHSEMPPDMEMLTNIEDRVQDISWTFRHNLEFYPLPQ